MKVLDTSVAIDHLRGRGHATALLESLLTSGEDVAASELTRFELLGGVRPDEHDQIEKFFGTVDWVPVTEDIVRQAGTYARTYRRSHSGIDTVDYVIAATASTLDAELLTLNTRHFPMFTDLQPPYRYD